MSHVLTDPDKNFFLGHFIEEVRLGQPFVRSHWPLHITLVPWFTCRDLKKLDADLIESLGSIRPFKVKTGREEMFGSKKNIKVNAVESNEQLTELHKILLNKVNSIGRLESDRQFVGKTYRGHITHSDGRYVPRGKTVFVDSIHLTELSDDSHCTPLRAYGIGT